ncbi:MAG: Fmu (Sun) domain-containing protein, partial [Ferruginibacter sp.]
MSRFHSYINTAKYLLENYKGDKPFVIFAKQFFAANKKYGAKDRRHVSSLCFNYFRLGFFADGLAMEEKMLLAKFICDHESSELMEKLRPEWNDQVKLPIDEKLSIATPGFSIKEIFPLAAELSNGIDVDAFCRSFLVQPDLFIRIRPSTRMTALKKLERSKIPYQIHGEDCVQMPQGTRVEDHFIIDKEVVIQDYSSQQVLNFLKDEQVQNSFAGNQSKTGVTIWDCCAASGGKSILVTDIFNGKLDLTISDIRASIVLNLHQRFIKAGIKAYKYFISDVSDPDFTPIATDFEVIICDAPCTGSGTWSRTPEQLCYFNEASTEEYNQLQKKIVTHVMPHLQTGGLFIYITCSVFKKENEEIVEFITENFNCKIL